ncbi:zinc-ribbon domain-containing protein [Halopenitus malekzadehii]|uniref:Zinc-ribbon domain-containing protein n=1 Tax=Halopenitus malekzadehii TaxID=1267564 RepID=A0A1H6HNK6_9EURY|nr:TM2 domain-containing protein [Halopenitus malekzadehii]SEH36672.1 zinc-ribbon domain-containing protein [Halopenitus malekzadehii]
MPGPTDDDSTRDRRSRSDDSDDDDDRVAPAGDGPDDAGWEDSDDRGADRTGRRDADDGGAAGRNGGRSSEPNAQAGPNGQADPNGQPGPNEQFCSSCGTIIKKQAEICPECGVRQGGAAAGGAGGAAGGAPAGGAGAARSSKDRTTAGILALLLGGIGAHKFYLGENGMGLLYLCFSWTFIPAIIGFIEGILYLTKTDEEFQRQYV